MAKKVVALFCALILGACFPAVTHGPRVEPGFTAGVTGAYTTGDTHVEGDEGGIHLRQGVIGPYAGYGWSAASARSPRLYLGVAVPVKEFLAESASLQEKLDARVKDKEDEDAEAGDDSYEE